MDVSTLTKKIENITEILDAKNYIKILSKDNNLTRFDLFNQLIILSQAPDAELFDIRTELEWYSVGRKLLNKSKGIYVLVPMYANVFRDAETGEALGYADLNPLEVEQAINLGIVTRTKEISSVEVELVYDVMQTTSSHDRVEYKIPRANNSMKDILAITYAITGTSVERSSETKFDTENNKLYLSMDTYTEMASTVLSILSTYLVDSNQSKLEDSGIPNYDNVDKQLILDSIIYMLSTLFRVSSDSSLFKSRVEEYCKSRKHKLYSILLAVDSLGSLVTEMVTLTDGSLLSDGIYNIQAMKKAEDIYNLLEAVNAMCDMNKS